MSAADRYLEFVHLPSFVNSAKGLIGDDEQRELEAALVKDPEVGPIIRGTGGVRKLRVALEGRGKSGGARVIYYYRSQKGRVYLLLAYGKNEQENITADEKKVIRRLVERLETEP